MAQWERNKYDICSNDFFSFSKYYNYSVSNDGVEEMHGGDYATDYFTDVVKREAVHFIKNHSDAPLFAYIATPAPHRPATPAPQYAFMYSDEVAPRTPSYGLASYSKHWLISVGEGSDGMVVCVCVCLYWMAA